MATEEDGLNQGLYFNDLPPEAQKDMDRAMMEGMLPIELRMCEGRIRLYFISKRDGDSGTVFKLLHDVDCTLRTLEEFRAKLLKHHKCVSH